MSLLQIKILKEGRLIAWRPGQAGSWLLPINNLIEHGDLKVYLSNGGGEVEIRIFRGKKPPSRQVLRRNGTYILGAKTIKRM